MLVTLIFIWFTNVANSRKVPVHVILVLKFQETEQFRFKFNTCTPCSLAHFQPMFDFFTPWKHQKTAVLWCFKRVKKWNIGWKWVKHADNQNEIHCSLLLFQLSFSGTFNKKVFIRTYSKPRQTWKIKFFPNS